jgi:hypothetical protein
VSDRLILVGESNPYGSNPDFALYCYPPGCAGYRLRRIVGLPQHQYLALPRVNLCEGDWSLRAARDRASLLVDDQATPPVVVMLGRKVADAFGYGRPFFTRGEKLRLVLVSLPHPSGRSTIYNDPKIVARTRQLLREVVPEVPWGCIDAEDIPPNNPPNKETVA